MATVVSCFKLELAIFLKNSGCFKVVVFNLPNTMPFNTVPHVVMTPKNKTILIATLQLEFCYCYES